MKHLLTLTTFLFLTHVIYSQNAFIGYTFNNSNTKSNSLLLAGKLGDDYISARITFEDTEQGMFNGFKFALGGDMVGAEDLSIAGGAYVEMQSVDQVYSGVDTGLDVLLLASISNRLWLVGYAGFSVWRKSRGRSHELFVNDVVSAGIGLTIKL